MSYSEDLDFMLSDAPDSVSVAFGSLTGFGIRKKWSEGFDDSAPMKVWGIKDVLVFNPSTFPGLVKGVAIVVDGESMEVGHVLAQKDGSYLAELVKP